MHCTNHAWLHLYANASRLGRCAPVAYAESPLSSTHVELVASLGIPTLTRASRGAWLCMSCRAAARLLAAASLMPGRMHDFTTALLSSMHAPLSSRGCVYSSGTARTLAAPASRVRCSLPLASCISQKGQRNPTPQQPMQWFCGHQLLGG